MNRSLHHAPVSAARQQPQWIERLHRGAAPLAILLVVGLWFYTRTVEPRTEQRAHAAGEHSGAMSAFAAGRLHAEAVVDQDNRLLVYILAADAERPATVNRTPLTAFLRRGADAAAPVQLEPWPRSLDAPDRTSRFVTSLPEELAGSTENAPLEIIIPEITLGREQFRLALLWGGSTHEAAMPAKVVEQRERDLYLTPAGKYTDEDIAANGGLTASEAFVGFQAEHDFSPARGDTICPITRTKANPACSWIINGERYEFCCPPCVDELVTLAKEQPELLQPPESYVR